jgi:hypothetical protein
MLVLDYGGGTLDITVMTIKDSTKVTQTVERAVGGIENIDFVIMSGGTSLNREAQRAVMALFRHLPESKFVLPNVKDRECRDLPGCGCQGPSFALA